MTTVPEPTPFPAERTAILTGAASPRGIGRACAHELAAQGWSVAILDVDGEQAAQAARELAERHGVAALGLRADVTDPASVDVAVGEVEASLPSVVALVNLAGVSSPTGFLDETLEGWERVFRVNVTGAFLVTQRVAAGMAERRAGRIVSISSISAERGGGTYSKSAYSASKAAVIGLMRAVARELGPLGITANAIAPGPIDTDIMGGPLTDERRAAMAEGTLLGRIGTPADVAALVAFLVSEKAGYVTAATYDVNGGLHIS